MEPTTIIGQAVWNTNSVEHRKEFDMLCHAYRYLCGTMSHSCKGQFIRIRSQQYGRHYNTTWFRAGTFQQVSVTIRGGFGVEQGCHRDYHVTEFVPETGLAMDAFHTTDASQLLAFLTRRYGIVSFRMPKPRLHGCR